MTRPSQNAPLHTVAGRRGLPRKASPWWRGVYLGLRVGWHLPSNNTTGRWLARLALPNNDVRQVVLGHADDAPVKADGVRVLTYAQAVSKAQAWAATVTANPHAASRSARRASSSGSPDAVTVRGALLAYAETKARGSQMLRAGEVRTLIEVHLPAALGNVPVSGLTATVLNDWLHGLDHARGPGRGRTTDRGRHLSQARVDGLRGIMKAALRAAGAPAEATAKGLDAGAVRNRVEPATRNLLLTRVQVDALVRELGHIDPALGLFAKVLSVTGARPGSLARCTLADLDVITGGLHIPRSAKGKPGLRKSTRGVPSLIPADLAKEIAAQADSETGLLFHATRRSQSFEVLNDLDATTLQKGALGRTWRASGRCAWSKNYWSRPMREAVRRSGLPPAVTAYTLRHCWAVELIRGGLSLREVAALLDTSVSMLEKTYSREIGHDPRTLARLQAVQKATSSKHPPTLRVVV